MFLLLLLDTDCSGRALATLLVAWVGTAIVASILLRWKYMWIALAVLTLLFLLACGYTACHSKAINENARAINGTITDEESEIRRRRHMRRGRARSGGREAQITTVSSRVDNCFENEPPGYQAFWITDLPPSYASVIGSGSSILLPVHTSSLDSASASSSSYPYLCSIDSTASPPPPPYAIAIESHAKSLGKSEMLELRQRSRDSSEEIPEEDEVATVTSETIDENHDLAITRYASKETSTSLDDCLTTIFKTTFGKVPKKNDSGHSSFSADDNTVSNERRTDETTPDLENPKS
ncbi:uncharacterized protein [Prorops nasuta]|uniref:uncharacterized protein isoform X2 n=1 Tax=Prorops nasuta TaxID=863751 RepID=UPI0034CE5AF7